MRDSRKLLLIIFLGTLQVSMLAQDVRIALFYHQLTESITFHTISGEYTVLSDNQEIATLKNGDIVYVKLMKDNLTLSTSTRYIGEFSKVVLKDRYYNGRFMLRSIYPSSNQRLYMGDLILEAEHGTMKMMNEFEFDHYLAGVVEAEAGAGAPDEFFKVQAVLCRTYAVRNWERHDDEGFNLCDDTHCQVFHGVADDNPEIYTAVLSTHGMVVTDKNYNLISAAYHGNSGGETQRADDVWPGKHDYLLPIIDSFSYNQPGYRWTKELNLETWENYLVSRGASLDEIREEPPMIHQNHRINIFVIGKDTLRISNIREDFDLRSAFFSMSINGDKVIFEGKGYGHGIGLSQEGAMEMVRKGYSYEDIIHFYYFDVQVRNLNEIPVVNIPSVFR